MIFHLWQQNFPFVIISGKVWYAKKSKKQRKKSTSTLSKNTGKTLFFPFIFSLFLISILTNWEVGHWLKNILPLQQHWEAMHLTHKISPAVSPHLPLVTDLVRAGQLPTVHTLSVLTPLVSWSWHILSFSQQQLVQTRCVTGQISPVFTDGIRGSNNRCLNGFEGLLVLLVHTQEWVYTQTHTSW